MVCNTCAEGETCVSDDKINWRCGQPDVNTMVCNTCAEGETSVSDDKINWRSGQPDELSGFPEPELLCGQDHLRLTVQKRLLEERGLNASSAHLIDPRCHQQVDQQEEMWYLVQRRKGICGNMVEVDADDAKPQLEEKEGQDEYSQLQMPE
ncbi:hypothetical protein PFLUV_G00128080 [Perca fluviatilis]|uniref:ZP-N domain-containing protein n=1 Tax=Perca fluviatilis TaxID=8168 RepID=A0A6A5E394_PERFL|nr:hypothetical protein PFLUV_G00128080 [Perca fluviatilis]